MISDALNNIFVSPKAKKWTLLSLLLVVLITVFSLVYNHGYLSVSVTGVGNGKIHYVLVEQSTGASTSILTSAHTIKRLVHKGGYEIFVVQGDSSYLALDTVGGFLKTKPIRGPLVAEQSRKFIGNAPSSCMYYSGQLLLSYDCNGSLVEAKLHLPSSLQQPTYAKLNPISIPNHYSGVEGLVKTPEGSFVLLHSTDTTSTAPAHALYQLNDDFTLGDGHLLAGLDKNTAYSIEAYKSGFVVFNSSFSNILYYTSVNIRPSAIKLPSTVDGDLEAYAHDVNNDTIAVGYTNRDYEPRTTGTNKVTKQSKVVIERGGGFKELTFPTTYGSIRLCGNQKLCLLKDKLMEVYDISSSKQKLLYTVSDVVSIHRSGDEVLLARGSGIIQFNVDKQTGFTGYSFGVGTYCGLQTAVSGYIICVSNGLVGKVALYIDQTSSSNDNIDKKVFNLARTPEVKAVSAYGSIIFVSPRLGEPIFNPESGYFEYSPELRTRVNKIIDRRLIDLGFDEKTYTIINTSE